MSFFRPCLLLLILAFSVSSVFAGDEEDYESKDWKEVDVPLPAAPKQESMLPFYVSAATDNRFFIDGASLSVGGDGVVRYVLLILSPQGGRTVSFEGMRCETRERRIYASGRSDGTWSRARKSEWVDIQDVSMNRYHAALFNDYFCPFGIIVRDAAEARKVLQQGARLDYGR